MNKFQEKLVKQMHEYVRLVYKLTKDFPKEEMFGSTSQIRRATLSVVLNYIEGFARRRASVQLNFFEISYGSLKESKYLLFFATEEGWINEKDYKQGLKLIDEIGAMLWSEIISVEKTIKKQKNDIPECSSAKVLKCSSAKALKCSNVKVL